MYADEENYKTKYQQLIDELFILNKIHRSRVKKEIFSKQHYAKEFCTIKCDIGRQTGKTTYILNRSTENDLIITHSYSAATRLMGRTQAKVTTIDILMNDLIDNSNSKITTIDILMNDLIDNSNSKIYETIYIDEPTMSLKNIDIYYFLVKNYEQTFVFLGI
jgi:hypothetical protein